MIKWVLILFTVTASSSGDILCAKGMSRGGALHDFGPSGIARAIRYIITRRMVILGGLCYATAFFSMLGLFSVVPLSIAVPATALGFVFDTFGACFILREHVHWKRWVGVACVTSGVLLAVHSGPSVAAAAPNAQAAEVAHGRAHPHLVARGSAESP